MTLPLLFAYSFVVGFAAVVSPGPVSTAIVSESARRGFLVGPLVATGHSFLEFLMVVALAAGLAAGLNQPAIQAAIGLVGGAFLIWMGGGMLLGVYRQQINLPAAQAGGPALGPAWRMVGLGMAATLANPFWYAWWVAVAVNYLALAQGAGWAGVMAFYFGHISADYAWDSVLSGVVAGGRRWLNNTVYRVLIAGCGLYLIYLGGQFGWRGIQMVQALLGA
jgi:threonine/homoserine/homoserine lactone efflux protein